MKIESILIRYLIIFKNRVEINLESYKYLYIIKIIINNIISKDIYFFSRFTAL